jgi:AcrR family transcriptional regulator
LARRAKSRIVGRPKRAERDAVVKAVLEATLTELRAVGFHNLRVQSVAERSGVNRTTIYRRWPSKWKLVLAAWASAQPALATEEIPATLERELYDILCERVQRMEEPEARRITQAVMSLDDKETAALAIGMHESGSAAVKVALRRAIAAGELRDDLDVESAAASFLAIVKYNALFKKHAMSQEEISRVIDLFLRGARRK